MGSHRCAATITSRLSVPSSLISRWKMNQDNSLLPDRSSERMSDPFGAVPGEDGLAATLALIGLLNDKAVRYMEQEDYESAEKKLLKA